MNTKLVSRIGLIAGFVALLVGSVYAGGWSNQLSSPNGNTVSFTGSVYVPSAAWVQQAGGVYSDAIGVNSGPLGYYQFTNGNTPLYVSGNIPGGGTVNIYQALVRGSQPVSGYCVTAIQW